MTFKTFCVFFEKKKEIHQEEKEKKRDEKVFKKKIYFSDYFDALYLALSVMQISAASKGKCFQQIEQKKK